MIFADELRAIAGAHDEQKNKEQAAREAATHEVLREYFAEVRGNLQTMLRDAAASGREKVVITTLYKFPVPERHLDRELAHTMTFNSTRMLVPHLVEDSIYQHLRRQRDIGGMQEWEVRGDSVQGHLVHPELRELWDDVVALGLEPYLYVHPEHGRKVDLMVTIPR